MYGGPQIIYPDTLKHQNAYFDVSFLAFKYFAISSGAIRHLAAVSNGNAKIIRMKHVREECRLIS